MTTTDHIAESLLNFQFGVGLAPLRLEHLDAPLRAGEARLTAKKPDWVDI